MDARTIDKLLRLSALTLPPPERARLEADLERIVGFVDAMQAANTDGVAPLAHPLDGVLAADQARPVDATQPLRSDAVTEAVDRERFQRLAPDARDGLYLVPRVVE